MSASIEPRRLRVIDSHTGGEPTRVVVSGLPDLGTGSLRDRLNRLRQHDDWIRTSLVTEPRGSDVMVGAILTEPTAADCVAGVIFFNNSGYLHMCGHGMIGFVVTLAYLGRIGPGTHRVDTPVGVVTAELLEPNRVRIQNVPSYRYRKAVPLEVPSLGTITGDIAWGGNWFFLVSDHGLNVHADHLDELTRASTLIRRALNDQNITGEDGGEIDHIELFGPADDPAQADSKSFVLCPGLAYDRSPCGTGTSAKLACLAADGKLAPGTTWRQQSIIGSIFEGTYQNLESGQIIPAITGSAWVNAEVDAVFHPDDPFACGIPGLGDPGHAS